MRLHDFNSSIFSCNVKLHRTIFAFDKPICVRWMGAKRERKRDKARFQQITSNRSIDRREVFDCSEGKVHIFRRVSMCATDAAFDFGLWKAFVSSMLVVLFSFRNVAWSVNQVVIGHTVVCQQIFTSVRLSHQAIVSFAKFERVSVYL